MPSKIAAPPTPWSKDLTEPFVDPSAYVHHYANLIGDVHISADVMVAPGTSIRADEGTPFWIGEGSNVQDGVVIHGLEEGRVVGDDGEEYSVWIGSDTSITHLSLIHGPAYVGNNCFIGFRSTVFNSRVGHGCIVMMHCLIQGVEIPPGKYIPSGTIITNQQQADRLPDVQASDAKFAEHVIHVNDALREGYQCAKNVVCIAPLRQEKANAHASASFEVEVVNPAAQAPDELRKTTLKPSNGKTMTGSFSPDLIDRIRHLVAQGYRIGTEYADERHFRTSSWRSGTPIGQAQMPDILRALQQEMTQHSREYVRVLGIDPKAKRRILEAVIHHPDEAIPDLSSASSSHSSSSASYSSHSSASSSSSSSSRPSSGSELGSTVQGLLAQGYRVGVEIADARRFRTSSWTTVPMEEMRSAPHLVQTIEQVMAEHPNHYVRLLGIDAKAKRRVLEEIIKTPGGVVKATPTFSQGSGGSSSVKAAQSGGSSNVRDHIQGILSQGLRVSLEVADARRFRTSSWTSMPVGDGRSVGQVLGSIEQVMADHPSHYVRLLGIDPQAKRRVVQEIIQTPHGKPSSSPSGSPAPAGHSSSNGNGNGHGNSGSHRISAEVQAQVRSLLQQGYKIGTEHVDSRRYRTGSWKSCSPIDTIREAEVIKALEACLDEHKGEYVRLLGIDPKIKKRVLEQVIQSPRN